MDQLCRLVMSFDNRIKLFFLTIYSESCSSGHESVEGIYCVTCPVDTYKNKNDASRCLPCQHGRTTGGQLGAIKCRCKFFHAAQSNVKLSNWIIFYQRPQQSYHELLDPLYILCHLCGLHTLKKVGDVILYYCNKQI